MEKKKRVSVPRVNTNSLELQTIFDAYSDYLESGTLVHTHQLADHIVGDASTVLISEVESGRLIVSSLRDDADEGEDEYPFKCIATDDGVTVVVRAGWWAYYYKYLGGEPEEVRTRRVQVDFVESEITVTETSTIMLKINMIYNTLTVISVPAVPAIEDSVYYKKLSEATVVDGVITELKPVWKGGVLLSLLSDDLSEGVDEGQGGTDPDAEDDIYCNQNNHPADPDDIIEDDNGDGTGHPDDNVGGAGGDTGTETGHPSDPDCYSTVPDPIT